MSSVEDTGRPLLQFLHYNDNRKQQAGFSLRPHQIGHCASYLLHVGRHTELQGTSRELPGALSTSLPELSFNLRIHYESGWMTT